MTNIEQLEAWRKELGLNQKQWVGALDISESLYSLMKSGERRCGRHHIVNGRRAHRQLKRLLFPASC